MKRFLALTLSIILIFALLVGCAPKEGNENVEGSDVEGQEEDVDTQNNQAVG